MKDFTKIKKQLLADLCACGVYADSHYRSTTTRIDIKTIDGSKITDVHLSAVTDVFKKYELTYKVETHTSRTEYPVARNYACFILDAIPGRRLNMKKVEFATIQPTVNEILTSHQLDSPSYRNSNAAGTTYKYYGDASTYEEQVKLAVLELQKAGIQCSYAFRLNSGRAGNTFSIRFIGALNAKRIAALA